MEITIRSVEAKDAKDINEIRRMDGVRENILDLADNWLMIVRLELGVFIDNEKAIKLYKSFGFEIEGTRRYAAIRNGQYADEYAMSRYKNI